MRTTIARTMRSLGRRTHSPGRGGPIFAVLAPAGLPGRPRAHFRRACRVACHAAGAARIGREAASDQVVVLGHPSGRPAVKIFPYLSIH